MEDVMNIKNQWLQDIESRGKVSFNTATIKSHKEAEKYARKTYKAVIEQEVFVAGWNMAYWDEQERVLKQLKKQGLM